MGMKSMAMTGLRATDVRLPPSIALVVRQLAGTMIFVRPGCSKRGELAFSWKICVLQARIQKICLHP